MFTDLKSKETAMPRFHNTDGVDVQFTAAEEAAWDARFSEYDPAYGAAIAIRKKRDAKLAACDWMANSDVTMSDEWRVYRQALRDVPTQAGFPNSVTWPSEPS